MIDRLGLGHAELRADNPRLVYCSMTGFGSSGPMVDAPGSDSMMQAYGTLMSIVGGPPTCVGTVVSDMLAADNAISAVLLALLRRGRTGAGVRAEASLLDSLLAFQSTAIVDHLVSGQVRRPPGNRPRPVQRRTGPARGRERGRAEPGRGSVRQRCWPSVWCARPPPPCS